MGAFGERDVSFCIAVADGEMVLAKDGFGSDTDEIGFGCHLLPYFNPDTNANTDLIGYEYKTDSLNLDSDPDTFSILNIEVSFVSVYFVNNFIVNQNYYTSSE